MSVNIGDVVTWDAVPDGALVRDGVGDYAVRQRRNGRTLGSWVKVKGEPWLTWTGSWLWRIHEVEYTVVALGLTGGETADDLRRLAETPLRTAEDERRDVLAYIRMRAIEWDTADLRPGRSVAIADLEAEIFMGRHTGAAEVRS